MDGQATRDVGIADHSMRRDVTVSYSPEEVAWLVITVWVEMSQYPIALRKAWLVIVEWIEMTRYPIDLKSGRLKSNCLHGRTVHSIIQNS